MCVNDMKNIDTVIDHTIDLVVQKMKEYNVPLDRVVTHHAASKKVCPAIFAKNNWTKWVEFKTLVAAKLKGGYEEMKKEDIVAIVNEIVKPGIITEKHWADSKVSSLKSKGLTINEVNRNNDMVTRGELFSVVDDAITQTIKLLGK